MVLPLLLLFILLLLLLFVAAALRVWSLGTISRAGTFCDTKGPDSQNLIHLWWCGRLDRRLYNTDRTLPKALDEELWVCWTKTCKN